MICSSFSRSNGTYSRISSGASASMFSLSLVVPVLPDRVPSKPEIEGLQRNLEASGRFSSVEILVVIGRADLAGAFEEYRYVLATERGMVSLAHAGLLAASGDVAVVLDPSLGYLPESVLSVLIPVIEGHAEVSIGKTRSRRGLETTNRSGGNPGGRISGLLRPVLGTSAPFSGLIGLRRDVAETILTSRALHAGKPSAGSFFVLDLVSRIPGRRVDVEVDRERRARIRPPALNDVRQVKSLFDERFGNYSRLVQFCLVGASGMVVDLSFYAFFQWLFARPWLFASDESVFGASWQLASAGGLSIFLALIWNFTLNRRLTFNDAMSGNILRQFVTYALGNAVGVALSFFLRLYLPAHVAFFNQHKLAAAVVGIVAATGISFSMSRWIVFSSRNPPEGKGPKSEAATAS